MRLRKVLIQNWSNRLNIVSKCSLVDQIISAK
jgi:hypothetical protein